jgi:hypothetical protein
MHHDLQRGRPLEVRWLSGGVAEMGAAAGVPTPVNRAVYDVLAQPSTHLQWAGDEAPNKLFKLLSLESPGGRAVVGTKFTSMGSNMLGMVFHDQSVVTEAAPPSLFVFETTSHLERKHRRPWEARFVHRYEVRPEGSASCIENTVDVYPLNYRPWWLHPLVRPMIGKKLPKLMAANMRNLARTAERHSGNERL